MGQTVWYDKNVARAVFVVCPSLRRSLSFISLKRRPPLSERFSFFLINRRLSHRAKKTARCAVLRQKPDARMVARRSRLPPRSLLLPSAEVATGDPQPLPSRGPDGRGSDRRNRVPGNGCVYFGRISPDGSPASNRLPATLRVQTTGSRGKRIVIRCPDGSGRTLRGNRADHTVLHPDKPIRRPCSRLRLRETARCAVLPDHAAFFLRRREQGRRIGLSGCKTV